MERKSLDQSAISHLHFLCEELPGRQVGSQGNLLATDYFKGQVEKAGWETELQEFEAMDWETDGASLSADKQSFEVYSSPYSKGVDVNAILVAASSMEQLKQLDADGKILLLHGELAREQLMPKNFVFYNPATHQQIIRLLEGSGAVALVTATQRNPSLAGGVYPFPLIEDGDFDIPSVFMTEKEGERFQALVGKEVALRSAAKRIPSKGYNVIARKGKNAAHRILVTAHIDAKKGTPGALDNATGVTVLLLLAELLSNYKADPVIELVPFNGEDYYAVPGQMTYLNSMTGKMDQIALNINIDGMGYKEGPSAISYYGVKEELQQKMSALLKDFSQIAEGPQWVQGDHSMFVQAGRPAIAFTSRWLLDNMETQDITHTSEDTLSVVNVERVVEVAELLNGFLQ